MSSQPADNGPGAILAAAGISFPFWGPALILAEYDGLPAWLRAAAPGHPPGAYLGINDPILLRALQPLESAFVADVQAGDLSSAARRLVAIVAAVESHNMASAAMARAAEAEAARAAEAARPVNRRRLAILAVLLAILAGSCGAFWLLVILWA